MDGVAYSDDLLDSADCVVIVTDHTAYDWQHVVDHSKLIVDTRHAVHPHKGHARVITL
jgi:UDP-N-acetyl-D-glucosamine dehydrogenase